MLAPRASSAFVCLRCELSNARPRLSALHRRAFSASHRRRDALDAELEQEKPRPTVSEHPLGRVRKGRGGRAVRELTARLEGAKTLGEDASILVLKEVGDGKKEDRPPPEIVAHGDAHDPLGLAESIADQQPATLEEVVEQLDSLRPKPLHQQGSPDEEGHYVGQSVFIRLSGHLMRAFTANQLSHYYSIRKGVGKSRVNQEVMEGLKRLRGEAKRPAERSAWTPGTTQMDRRLPGLDVHTKVRRKLIGKHLLVDQILRDVWKLVMLEEIEAAGELELALKDWQLALLTSGAPETALDRIGKARMAKIELHAADKVLRITADKHTAEYAADDVEQLLRKSEASRFYITPWIPHLEGVGPDSSLYDVFSEEALQTVASLTGAYIQKSTKNIIIRAFDKPTVAEAERCLIKMMPWKSRGPRTVDTTGRDGLSRADQFLPVFFEKETVSYRTRDAKLGRWSLPVNRAGTPPSESGSVAERLKATQEHIVNMMSEISSRHQHKSKSGVTASQRRWAYNPETRFKAMFGHVLFPLDNPAADATAEKTFFVAALPGLPSIFSTENYHMRFVTPASLRYEFVAQPGPENYTSELLPYEFPKLCVYFRPNHTGEHSLRKVVLELGTAVHQVLLPEEAVDISFQANQNLLMNDIQGNKTVKAFEQKVLENLQSGGRLSAPNIELEIPRWTIGGMPFGDKEDMYFTKFLFTGLTFSQTVWGRYMGCTVSYATAQSGKLGGKGGLFSAIYGVNEQSKKIAIPDPEKALKTFVADCFKVAGKTTQAAAASKEGFKKVQTKPKPQKSAHNVAALEVAQGEAAVAGSPERGVSTQTIDSQEAPMSPALSEDSTSLQNPTDRETSADQSLGNNAQTAQSGNSILHIPQPGSQVPRGGMEDPYISSIHDNNGPAHNEPRVTDDATEEEEKRRLESTA